MAVGILLCPCQAEIRPLVPVKRQWDDCGHLPMRLPHRHLCPRVTSQAGHQRKLPRSCGRSPGDVGYSSHIVIERQWSPFSDRWLIGRERVVLNREMDLFHPPAKMCKQSTASSFTRMNFGSRLICLGSLTGKTLLPATEKAWPRARGPRPRVLLPSFPVSRNRLPPTTQVRFRH